jgi:putative phage-type endonuclease
MALNCKVVEVQQGTEEWLALRRGRITASRMGDVIAKPTTKRYQQYQNSIVCELLGFDDDEPDAPWMAHGREMEPYARGAYEWKYDCETTADVFCIHPEHDWLAASPDGLILPDYSGAIEIKCREKYDTYLRIVQAIEDSGKIESSYRPQVQGQMMVMGLDRIDFCNYYHDAEQRIRKLHVHTVHRDDEYIAKLETSVMEFMHRCYEIANKEAA